MRQARTLAIVLLCAVGVTGQTNRGGISGTVTDTAGAVVPGATVTITNLGTNQTLKLTTSPGGAYSATSLEPVTYRITVEAAGFRRAAVESVKVDTATTAAVNVTLEPGAAQSQITVTAEAPLLNTESGTVSQTVSEREIQDIPLLNRSVLDLAVTLPNVSGDVGSENPGVTAGAPVPGFNLSLDGGRPGSTAILADGVNNTGVGIARAVVTFSPETVQEFTVQTSAYSAQYGMTGGGIINATTKSGTNQVNGTALWYQRNPALNAAPFTTSSTNRPPSLLRENQFHFSVGGPVVLPKIYNGHDRTFFFFAVEPRYREDFLITDTLLPTDAMRGGDFSGLARVSNGWAPADVVAKFGIAVTGPSTIYQQYTLVGNQLKPIALASGQLYQPFPGNVIPQNMMDPTALKALQFMPHAGAYFIDGSGLLSNYVVNRFVHENEVRYTTRVDHKISNDDQLSFRYTLVPVVGATGFASDINGNTASYSHSQQALITETHLFSPTLINEARINYTRGTFSNDFTPQFSIKGGQNLATELGLPSLTSGGMPLFEFLDGPNAFANIGSSGSTNNYNVEERYNASDLVYWNRGTMSWKFGAEVSHELLNVIPFFGASGGRWDFRVIQTSNNRSTQGPAGGNSFASYLMGVSNLALIRPVLIPYYYRWNSGDAFAQNDWKVRPNLTLNLGLRYSLQLPRTEKNNLQGAFVPELAKQFPLAQPITLVTGQVIDSALVPPFAYAGRGGRSKYLTPIEWTDFEPRIAFAWSPGMFGKLFGKLFGRQNSFVVRGGYGLSHVPLTGNNRLPNPDFGATNNVTTTTTGSSGTLDPTSALRLSSNPPLLKTITPGQALKIPADGLVYLNSLAIPGFALSKNTGVPYVQNWTISLSYELTRNTVVEAGYVGLKGSHLFLPLININPRDFNFVNTLESSGGTQNADTNVTDPLGRKDLLGNALSIPLGSLATQYLGFNHLYSFYNTSGSSIRHAVYVSFNRRMLRGLTFTANYTYGKSLDNASDASPDKNVLTSGTTQGGAVTFGAPLATDYSISAFDIKHTFNSTFIYDLPFGRGRKLLANAWKPLTMVAGNWTVSGVFRLQSGFPFLPTISDTNRLSADLTHTIRPDIVPGVPLVNPLWNRNCPIGNLCEPYVNPAAFMRPIKGQLGDAPRTLDIRGPMQQYFDMSFQKNLPIGEKRRVQLRVDLINAFNHPVFRVNSGNAGPDFMGLPTETAITGSEYDAWAAFAAGRPARSTPAGAALFAQIQQFVTGNRLSTGALPLDYFHIRLPQGFATTNPNAIDITTLNGYKLYRLRQTYSTSFGTLRELGLPRYIQFGIKINF
jgi:hypothetical protein